MTQHEICRGGDDNVVLCPFISRSGSTFFFNSLSRDPDIFVCPEAEILVYRLVDLLQDRIPSGHSVLAKLATDMAEDAKLRDWGLEPNKFLEGYSEGFGLDVFLRVIIQYKNRLKPSAKYIFFKGPRKLLLFAEKSSRKFLQDRHIRLMTIIRDGRGAYASQKRSIRPSTGRPMEVSPVQSAIEWSDLVSRFEGLIAADKAPVHRVCYERLISAPDQELDGVYQYLDLPRKHETAREDADFEDRIPESHRHLHSKVGKPADSSRATSWRSELSALELALYQRAAGPALERSGYDVEACNEPPVIMLFGQLYYWFRDRAQKLELVIKQLWSTGGQR